MRRPYVAVWAGKRRWLPDLFEWWKKTGGSGRGASVTRPTRPAKRRLSGATGKYRIFIETNREHGSYAKESGVIDWGAAPAKVMLKENGEFEAVELSYGPGA